MGRILGWIGALFTITYLGGLAWLTRGRWEKVQELPLNELGDFLAGAFGPLAILWLVLGYFQQGIELRQNSSALHLQAEELKNSVEQQKQLVQASQEQLIADRAKMEMQKSIHEEARLESIRQAQPILSFTHDVHQISIDGRVNSYIVRILNSGLQPCTYFRIISKESGTTICQLDIFGSGAYAKFSIRTSDLNLNKIMEMEILFIDALGHKRIKELKISDSPSGLEINFIDPMEKVFA